MMSWTDTDLPAAASQTWHDTSLVKLQIDILLCPSYTSISQHLNNRLFLVQQHEAFQLPLGQQIFGGTSAMWHLRSDEPQIPEDFVMGLRPHP
jgi:hypothetical protein